MTAHDAIDILLVEDNPRDAELTIRTLRKHKLVNTIMHVKDGAEALEWIHGEGRSHDTGLLTHPKVVLLDLKLPKVDGLDVLRALRANRRTRLIPVVVLTSSHEDRDIAESYRLGANSYVVKPVDFDAFSAAVTETGSYWLLVNQQPTRDSD